jgi:hypothetical protein
MDLQTLGTTFPVTCPLAEIPEQFFAWERAQWRALDPSQHHLFSERIRGNREQLRRNASWHREHVPHGHPLPRHWVRIFGTCWRVFRGRLRHWILTGLKNEFSRLSRICRNHCFDHLGFRQTQALDDVYQPFHTYCRRTRVFTVWSRGLLPSLLTSSATSAISPTSGMK